MRKKPKDIDRHDTADFGTKSKYYFVLIIALAGFCANGLILFTDYPLWDAWWMTHILRNPAESEWLSIAYSHGGRPLDLMYLKPLAFVSNPVIWSKALGVSAWISAGCMVYLVFVKGRLLSNRLAFYLALLGVTMPLFDVMGDVVMLMNGSSPLLFWLGWLILFSLPDLVGIWKIGLRGISLILFFLSFNYNSQLVFFYGVAAVFVCLKINKAMVQEFFGHPVRKVIPYMDYALLPIIFWLWKSIFTPTHGYGAGYNSVKLNPEIFFQGYGSLATMFREEMNLFLFSPISFMVFLGCLCVFFAVDQRRPFRLDSIIIPGTDWKFVISGLFLIVAGSFSYVVVGQVFASTGFWTRNALLLNYPVAMVLLGVFCLTRRMLKLHSQWIIPSLVTACVMLFCVQNNLTILKMQSFGAKQYAVAAALRQATQPPDINAVNLRDYFFIPDTIPYYPPSIWSFLAAPPDKPPKVLVVDTRGMIPDQIDTSTGTPRRVVPLIQIDQNSMEQLKIATTMPYMFEEIPTQGRTITVTVEAGELGTDGASIGLRYLWLRWFNPTKLDPFINQVAKITIFDQ